MYKVCIVSTFWESHIMMYNLINDVIYFIILCSLGYYAHYIFKWITVFTDHSIYVVNFVSRYYRDIDVISKFVALLTSWYSLDMNIPSLNAFEVAFPRSYMWHFGCLCLKFPEENNQCISCMIDSFKLQCQTLFTALILRVSATHTNVLSVL